ncbi:MAG: sulfotransferase [Gammaproteobacteria bacterium]|nr:sulfotransferase [Gammaproteobacteria bacterium]
MTSIHKLTRNVSTSIRKRGNAIANEARIGARHLFLLSPPLSGSTAITQLIKTSPNVSVFPGSGEGQFLPEVKNILFVDERWNPGLPIDWARVRKIFFQYWSPLKPVRFEKSPPSIVRAIDLERVFRNSSFLITLRNPYAQIEGLLRRQWPFGEYGPQSSPSSPLTPKAAAEFWVKTAKYQLHNIEHLGDTCFFTYEELTERPGETAQRITDFLPGLGVLDTGSKFTAHNITGKPIKGFKNLNQQKIEKLTRQQIGEINQVLGRHEDLLERFQYQLLSNN